MDDCLVIEALQQPGDRAHQRRAIAAGQVDPPDRALKEHVAGEQHPLVVHGVRHVPRTVAGREDDVERQPGELERLAAGDGVLGIPRLVGTEARPRDEGHDVLQDRDLELRAVHRRARRPRDRRDSPDVVEVRVGQQDRVELDARVLDRPQQARRLLARVDHDRPVAALRPHEKAVLLHHAHREHPDVEGHQPVTYFAFGLRASCLTRRR
jgi:hypothetical protein